MLAMIERQPQSVIDPSGTEGASQSVVGDEHIFATSEHEHAPSPAPNTGKTSSQTKYAEDDTVKNRDATNSSPAALEIVSPRPIARPLQKRFAAASVEDCWEDEATHESPATMPSLTASSFAASTTTEEAHRHPRTLDKRIQEVKPKNRGQMIREGSHEINTEPGSSRASQAAQQDKPRRRASVMDYLVTQGPAGLPPVSPGTHDPTYRSNPERLSWPEVDQGFKTNKAGGAIKFLPLHVGDENRSQTGWWPQPQAPQASEKISRIYDRSSAGHIFGESPNESWDHQYVPPAPSILSAPQGDARSDNYVGSTQSEYDTGPDNMTPSGYQLLAAKLSGEVDGQTIVPVYRRFGSLNHRLLLYMQEEITDLERQLIALEAVDTAKRSWAGGVRPASRRHDRWTKDNLAEQRTEILGLIGYKLGQYSKYSVYFLSSYPFEDH